MTCIILSEIMLILGCSFLLELVEGYDLEILGICGEFSEIFQKSLIYITWMVYDRFGIMYIDFDSRERESVCIFVLFPFFVYALIVLEKFEPPF